MTPPDIAWASPLQLETHLGLVVARAGLFSVRGVAVLASGACRRASVLVDTALLCVAFMVSVALARQPLGWWVA